MKLKSYFGQDPYLVKVGARYQRCKSISPLYNAAHEVLKEQRTAKMSELLDRGAARLLLVHKDRLRANLEWVMEQLVRDGMAERRGDEFAVVDLEHENKKLAADARRTLKQVNDEARAVQRYDQGRADPLLGRIKEFTSQLTARAATPIEEKSRLTAVQQDITMLLRQAEGMRRTMNEEIAAAIKAFTGQIRELVAARSAVAEVWRELVLPQDEIERLTREIEHLEKKVTDSSKLGRELLESEEISIANQISHHRARFDPRAPLADDPRQKIVQLVATRRPFDIVRVMVRVAD